MGRNLIHATRARLAVAVAAAGVVAAVVVLTGSEESRGTFWVERGGPCDDGRAADAVSAERPWCTLGRAAAAAPAGSTVRVRPGSYPLLAVSGRRNAEAVAFVPAGGGAVSVRGLRISGSAGFTFRGLRISDASRLENVADIRFERNEVSPSDIVVGGGRDLVFSGNRIHDLTIRRDPATGRCAPPRCGFGLRLSRVRDVKISSNVFRAIPADGIQLAGAERVAIERNSFSDISAFIDPAEHSDAIQVVGPSSGVAIRRNTFTRTRGVIVQPLDNDNFRGYSRRLRIERNNFSRLRDWALTLLDTPGAVISGNVATGARGNVRLFDQAGFPARMTGVVFTGNRINALEADPAMFARDEDNVIAASR
jgi:hypothetical protein